MKCVNFSVPVIELKHFRRYFTGFVVPRVITCSLLKNVRKATYNVNCLFIDLLAVNKSGYYLIIHRIKSTPRNAVLSCW